MWRLDPLMEHHETGAALNAVAAENSVDHSAVAVACLLAYPVKTLPVMKRNNINCIKGFFDTFKVEMGRETWFKLYESALGRVVT